MKKINSKEWSRLAEENYRLAMMYDDLVGWRPACASEMKIDTPSDEDLIKMARWYWQEAAREMVLAVRAHKEEIDSAEKRIAEKHPHAHQKRKY